MADIRFKKPLFPVGVQLRSYLHSTHREIEVPIGYNDLLHYNSSMALFGKNGADTLWETLIYAETDRQFIHESLRKIYAWLKVGLLPIC
jgi:hypothetical protein